MYLNLHTVIYNVDDLPKAKEWYSKIFSADPVVDQPSFVSFSVGSDRLGLSRVDKPMVCNDTFPVAYWVVSDIKAEYNRLIENGADELSGIQEMGEGLLVATVRDLKDGSLFGHVTGSFRIVQASTME